MLKEEKMAMVAQSLSERADRIRKAGVVEKRSTVPNGHMGYEPRKTGAAEKKVKWTSISYEKAGFREICMQFDSEKNLSRFLYRTAKLNGMTEITMADVRKMLKAADETIWILGDKHEFDEKNPDQRKPTWVMATTDKASWVALMKIVNAGYASSELKQITIKGEERSQRVWKLEATK